MSSLYSNSIFFIDIGKIKPNPFQPRREFEETKLKNLADSIRQYGVLQPLVVSRSEVEKDDGLATEYELIAGERRLRASKLAGLAQVPVIIRTGDDDMMKLELAIIENLQREDLNAVDRARAFMKLHEEFKFNFTEIGKKIGKSREYVSNTVRILTLPEEILTALSEGKINEGHTRPLMMLHDRPEEQTVLFKEIMVKKISVREAEKISRKIAFEKVRKEKYKPDPEIADIEDELREKLGTRVHIERKEIGGKIMIDFFSNEDLRMILEMVKQGKSINGGADSESTMLDRYIDSQPKIPDLSHKSSHKSDIGENESETIAENSEFAEDRSQEEIEKADNDTDLYNVNNFTL